MDGNTHPLASATSPPTINRRVSGSLYAQMRFAFTFGPDWFVKKASASAFFAFFFFASGSTGSASVTPAMACWSAATSTADAERLPPSFESRAEEAFFEPPFEPPRPTSARYLPPGRAISASCVPSSSTTDPSAEPPPAMPPAASTDPSTTILSAPRTVVSRCAMTIVVLFAPATSASSASCTKRSFSVSSAEVASSRIKIAGFLNAALAMAIRCFCPPESLEFLPPTTVSYPSGKEAMKSCAMPARAAATTSPRGTDAASFPAAPAAMFARIVSWNRSGSCDTTPIAARSASIRIEEMSRPSSSTDPLIGS
mmetsp:Transcript_5390/g.22810  ORF Transcript_5390/g.22810 Transcript_5390/m.22810 type:complete len:312 (-) Transcript_5390:1584-2519(-)